MAFPVSSYSSPSYSSLRSRNIGVLPLLCGVLPLLCAAIDVQAQEVGNAPTVATLATNLAPAPNAVSPVPPAIVPRIIVPRIELSRVAPVAPLTFNPSAVRVPAAIARLRAKKLTPQQAWDGGELNADDLLYFMGNSLDMWGGFTWDKDPDLRRALVALLVKHGGARIEQSLKKPETLSAPVRLWLADYYGSIKDDRVLMLCESILSEVKVPIKGENALVFQAVERIAWFHSGAGQYEKGAQAWLRMETLHADTGWWVPDAYMEAARLYARGGQAEKAQSLYAQIPKYGDGWLTGMAAYDQAQNLMDQGQYPQARQLLQQPITGRYANQIQVGLLSALGASYYRTKDIVLAQKYSQQAAQSYSALSDPLPDEGLKQLVTSATQQLEWIEKWKKAPLVCTASLLRFSLSPPAGKVTSAKVTSPKAVLPKVTPQEKMSQSVSSALSVQVLSVHALTDIPIKVTCEDPRVQVGPVGAGRQEEFSFVKRLTIGVKRTDRALSPGFETVLLVSSPNFPTFSLRLPVKVEAIPAK